jgi:hypothetical protein
MRSIVELLGMSPNPLNCLFKPAQRSIILCLSYSLIVAGCRDKPKNNESFADETSIKVNTNQMIFVSTENGVSLIDFTTIKYSSVGYRWRSWDKDYANEQTGCGTAVQEKKTIVEIANRTFSVATKMDLYITAGRVHIPWTPAWSNTVSLWYYPQKTAVKLLFNKEFDNFKVNDNHFENK